jgi:hypothetical protein
MRQAVSKSFRCLGLICLLAVSEQIYSGILAQPAHACHGGQLDYVKVGDTTEDMFLSFRDNRRVLSECGGPFEVRALGGGKYVFCQKSYDLDTMAKRLLVVNGVVVAIRGGVGNTSICSWDGN